MKLIRLIRLATAAGMIFAFGPGMAAADNGVIGAVYTMTNDPAGNQVLQYDRMADGSLAYRAHYDTGGQGTGSGLGNQGGVVLSDDGRWLLVVNAGSDDISVFRIAGRDLVLTDTESSGGVRPISVTIDRDQVYVVNAGGDVGDEDSIAALFIDNYGHLTLAAGSVQPLSAASTGPAQIKLSPNARFVVVTEKGTSTISVFPLDSYGYPGAGIFNPAAGQTPFAMDFGTRQQLFVSEVTGGAADSGAVSSYTLANDGTLETIAGSVANFETAPCWLVVTNGGRYVFTTNTPDDSLSAYKIDNDGQISLVDGDGRTGEPGAGTRPLDMDLSDDGRHLYTLNIGNGTISTFSIGPDGSLTETATASGLPAGVNGLAAR
jgi:6-phosphogluconolactonase (cycloisomerase 2 family)